MVSRAVGKSGSVFQLACIPPNPPICSERRSNQPCGVAVGDVLACRDRSVQWVEVDPRTLLPHRRVQLREERRTPPWHFRPSLCISSSSTYTRPASFLPHYLPLA